MGLRTIAKRIRLEARAFVRGVLDRRTPRSVRLIVLLMVGYVIFPFDIVPDTVVVFGLIDDIAIVGLALATAAWLIPPDVLRDYRPPRPANDNGGDMSLRPLALAMAFTLAGCLTLTLAAWWAYQAFL